MDDNCRELSYADAMLLAIKEEMAYDENVVILGEDIAELKTNGAIGAVEEKRIRSTPISENSFVGVGVGAAMTGLRPIVNLGIASFVYLASDQIINQASKLYYMTGGQMHVPIVIRLHMYHNTSFAAQHSDRTYPMFMNVPGLKIVVPATPADAKGLLKSAIRDDDPVLVFESAELFGNKGLVPTDSDFLIPIGKADIKKQGNDVTIVSIGSCLVPAMAAAESLGEEGISVEVIDVRTLAPLDSDTILKSVAKTGRLVILDSANRTNSAASEIFVVITELASDILKRPIQRVTTPDVHIPYSPAVEKYLYPDKEKVITAIKRIF